MDVALWIVSGLLAAVFLGAGLTKIAQPKAKLQANPQLAWTEDFSDPAIKGIGAAEVLGAAGLILPELLDVAEVLTPLAAVGLAILMVGAAITHTRRGERQPLPVNAVLFALAVFVAVGRF